MNLAILIGISEYSANPALPGCKNDVEVMEKILQATNKYEGNILSISSQTQAASVKERVTNWIEGFREKKIEEVLFYFTGHGDFHDGEFYFALSDFNSQKRNQTSLTNSEVDIWLRSLQPQMTLKIVDACHSGVAYIKNSSDELDTYLKGSSKNSFDKCYFMFSSMIDQSSWQHELSDFTLSFAKAFLNHSAETIRYRDIKDYISDEFARNTNKQTPYFVMQSNNTEVFCSITPQLKEAVENTISASLVLENTVDASVEALQSNGFSLKELVEADAAKYISQEEMLQVLECIESQLEEHHPSQDFASLYETDINFSLGYKTVPNLQTVGEWLKKNQGDLFAKPIYEHQSRDYSDLHPSLGQTYEWVIAGIELTAELPYQSINILAKPRFPNLKQHLCSIVFLVSKTEIHLFHVHAKYRDINWTEKKLETGFRWQKKPVFSLSDRQSILNTVQEIIEGFEQSITEEVTDMFQKPTNDD